MKLSVHDILRRVAPYFAERASQFALKPAHPHRLILDRPEPIADCHARLLAIYKGSIFSNIDAIAEFTSDIIVAAAGNLPKKPSTAIVKAMVAWVHSLLIDNDLWFTFPTFDEALSRDQNYVMPLRRKLQEIEPILTERGLNELVRREIVSRRQSPDPKATKTKRNFAFALHRSNSYYHEIIVDLGYYAPLHHLVRNDPHLRLIDFAQLIVHRNVPRQTREAKDPLLIQLKCDQLRFDGTPHLIIRKRADGVSLPLGIPGIQVDRGTESFQQVEKHLVHAIEFVEGKHSERHWGFDSSVIPFLFTHEARKSRAMQFVRQERGKCSFLLFQTIPDLGLLHHFPRPEHYDRNYQYKEGEPVLPANIHIFANPWQRVGHSDFYVNTFDEKGST